MRARLSLALLLLPTAALCEPPDESRCLDALEQLSALQAASPVYKLTAGEPLFLADADRPAEVARLEKSVAAACSTNPKERRRQQQAAYRLHVARSPECGFASERLADMQRPDSRDPKDDTARQRKLVAGQCPEVKLKDLWLVLFRGSLEEPGLREPVE